MCAQAHHDKGVQRPVGLAVAAAVESVALLAPRGGIDGCNAADLGKRTLRTKPATVVANGDK